MVRFEPTIPIYLQVMDEIKAQIVSGKLKPGQQLPSVRELAQNIQVNPNTIARAYQELERAGIVFTRRGQGTFVREEEKIPVILKQEKVQAVLSSFFKEMASLGVSPKEALSLAKNFSAEGGKSSGVRTDSRKPK